MRRKEAPQSAAGARNPQGLCQLPPRSVIDRARSRGTALPSLPFERVDNVQTLERKTR